MPRPLARLPLAATLLAGLAMPALSAEGDVVFVGGGVVTGTSGCTGRDPAGEVFDASYLAPVAGSTNGPNTVIAFRFDDRTADAFQKNGGPLGPAFQKVWGLHIGTRVDSFDPQMRITALSPPTITKATKAVVVSGAVKGWDRVPDCVVSFTLRLLRDPTP